MSTAIHAQRILEAWDRLNFNRFEAELEDALSACHTTSPSSQLESEQQAVLESVVQQLRNMPLSSDKDHSPQYRAGFLLLRHLRAR